MNTIVNNRIFEKFPILESDRLLFRPFQKKDVKQLFKIRSNEQVMKFMDIISLKKEKESETLIKSYIHEFKHNTGITWAIVEKRENLLIGSFSYWRIIKNHCRAEFGYSLHPDYWGKGYMTETFQTLLEYGFNQMHLHSMEANVNPENLQSIKLLERVGFKKEAYFRENFYTNKNSFADSIIYCLLESDIRNYHIS